MTLEPGDIVSTGTPAGVGSARDPRVWLKDGDELVVSSPQLGELRHDDRPLADRGARLPEPARRSRCAPAAVTPRAVRRSRTEMPGDSRLRERPDQATRTGLHLEQAVPGLGADHTVDLEAAWLSGTA